MCTAATYKTKDFYFGRTLDYDVEYGHSVTITPRNYPFKFRCIDKPMDNHYAIIGMAMVADDYPLYFEAVNEKGLGLGGLNFVGNAHYNDPKDGMDNICQFELIPWILGQCASVEEAKELLKKLNIVNISFRDDLPASDLHWILADESECLTIESVEEGLMVYVNDVGCLTNNPPFNIQRTQLNNYLALSAKDPVNNFSDKITQHLYSRGMGAIGLPGDLSSESRFVRVAFTKFNSVSGDSEEESVNQFFHILESVAQAKGCCDMGDGAYEITLYTSCCNTNKGIYYYTSYSNHQISAVNMHNEDLDGKKLVVFDPIKEEQVRMQN